LSQNEKADILNKICKPDLNYNFPIKTSVVGKKQKIEKLKFQFKWFLNFPWLAYSKSENLAYAINIMSHFLRTKKALIIKNWEHWCKKV